MGTQGDPRQPKSPRHGPPTAGFFCLTCPHWPHCIPPQKGAFSKLATRFPDLIVYDLDAVTAYKNALGVIETFLEALSEIGRPAPPPASFSEEFSRVTLRLPKSLQRELSLEAEHEDCSLNQHIINALCERRGALAQTSIQAVSGLHKFRHPNRKRNFATFDLFTPVPVWKAPDGQSNRPNQECSSCKEAAGMISGPL